jgi:hypothetical protein
VSTSRLHTARARHVVAAAEAMCVVAAAEAMCVVAAAEAMCVERRQDKAVEYPEYYLKPFHAYSEGNMCWQAAFEAEPATMAMALRVWPKDELTAQVRHRGERRDIRTARQWTIQLRAPLPSRQDVCHRGERRDIRTARQWTIQLRAPLPSRQDVCHRGERRDIRTARQWTIQLRAPLPSRRDVCRSLTHPNAMRHTQAAQLRLRDSFLDCISEHFTTHQLPPPSAILDVVRVALATFHWLSVLLCRGH